MAFGGFEKDRKRLKYICPAREYGATCPGQSQCPLQHSARIDLETDRRIFTPVARSSNKWTTLYNKRTSVERVSVFWFRTLLHKRTKEDKITMCT